jgi:hypothetical protein
MGAELLSGTASASTQEGIKNAAAPETPPRADGGKTDRFHNLANSPTHEEDSDTNWQVLPRQYELADFQPIKKLYRGYASKVYLAEDIGKNKVRHRLKDPPSGKDRRVVLKVYDLLRLSPLTKYQLDREIRLHASINHKNIIRLEAAFTQVLPQLFKCAWSCSNQDHSVETAAFRRGTCLDGNHLN